jgi:hypothetical protein
MRVRRKEPLKAAKQSKSGVFADASCKNGNPPRAWYESVQATDRDLP